MHSLRFASLAALALGSLGTPWAQAAEPAAGIQHGAVQFDGRRSVLDAAQVILGVQSMITLGHDGVATPSGYIDSTVPSAHLASIGSCRWLAIATSAVAGEREDGSLNAVGTVKDATGASWPVAVPSGTFQAGSLEAGSNHFLAIRTDGTPVAFGALDSGQGSIPSSLTRAVQVLAWGNWSAGLGTDGVVHAWGTDSGAGTPLPADLGACRHVARGSQHMLAVRQDGSVTGWGSNTQGQLAIPADLGACREVAAGFDFSAALREDGSVRTWGKGRHLVSTRTAFPSGESLGTCTSITGAAHALAGRGSDGRWSVIGFDYPGQAERLDQWGGLRSIAPAQYFTIGVRDDGTANAWGMTFFSNSSSDYGPVVLPADLGPVVSAAGGFYHGLLLQADGTVRGVGCNRSGEISVPADLDGVVQVAAGMDASLARRHDGSVRGWGTGWYGSNSITVIPAALPPSAWISAYYLNAGSVSTAGAVSVWGNDRPTPPAGLPPVSQLAMGGRHAIAMLPDGSVRAWGSGSYGTGAAVAPNAVPSDLGPVVQVSAGGAHNAVLQADGQVRAWGNFHPTTSLGSTWGVASVPAYAGRARFVASGAETLAFLTQGTCPADLDGSGQVDAADIGSLLTAFGGCGGCAADIDGSGEVDAADIGGLLVAFGTCP